MKRKYCSACQRFEFRQAVEQQPLVHLPAWDLSLAIVLGGYFLVLAFVVWRFG